MAKTAPAPSDSSGSVPIKLPPRARGTAPPRAKPVVGPMQDGFEPPPPEPVGTFPWDTFAIGKSFTVTGATRGGINNSFSRWAKRGRIEGARIQVTPEGEGFRVFRLA